MLSVQVLPRSVILRAVLSTVEIMTMLVAAHTWAGGELPATGWMLAAAGLVFAAGTVVLRGRVPMWVMAVGLAVVQFLVHCWMVVLVAPAPPVGHVHGEHLELTWRMLLAHAVGALVTVLVWHLRRRAVEVVLTWAEVGMMPVPALRRTVARSAPVLPLRRPLVVVPLRGPPVGRGSAA